MLTSPKKRNLSVPMRGGRVYHGGFSRVSIGLAQLYDKQSTNVPAYVQRDVRNCREVYVGRRAIQERVTGPRVWRRSILGTAKVET